MTVDNQSSDYRIYLLTLWAEQGREADESVVWRFSLKDPHTGQQRGFANLTTLVTALLEEIINAEEIRLKGDEQSQYT